MKMHVPMCDMHAYLTCRKSPWIINLPYAYRIVAAKVQGGDVVLTLHSQTFPPLPEGEPIPTFEPEYHGLKWRR
jgi:hypothetical protein